MIWNAFMSVFDSFLFAKSYIEKAIGRYDEETINIDHVSDNIIYNCFLKNIAELSMTL